MASDTVHSRRQIGNISEFAEKKVSREKALLRSELLRIVLNFGALLIICHLP